MEKTRPARALVGALYGVVAGTLATFSAIGCATTAPFTDSRGMVRPESIAVLEAVEIGGMEQWILIRGTDRSNPVLLWLHGGPGAAHMPVAQGWAEELEEYFLVVHWDQRGAGKSNPPDFDETTMTLERFVQDVHEVTEYLKDRLETEKMYLLGHSWGAELGLHVVQQRPWNYFAYIGVSQVVNRGLGEDIAYSHLTRAIIKEGSPREKRKLLELGPPPYHEHSRYVSFMSLINNHGGSYDTGFLRLAVEVLRAPEYRIPDYRAWLRGANRGSGPMWNQAEYRNFDARRHVPRLELPVFFIMGARDLNTPLEAVRRYFDVLDAPRGKELIVFDNAAHTPFFQDEQRFVEVLVRIRECPRPGESTG